MEESICVDHGSGHVAPTLNLSTPNPFNGPQITRTPTKRTSNLQKQLGAAFPPRANFCANCGPGRHGAAKGDGGLDLPGITSRDNQFMDWFLFFTCLSIYAFLCSIYLSIDLPISPSLGLSMFSYPSIWYPPFLVSSFPSSCTSSSGYMHLKWQSRTAWFLGRCAP